MPEISIKFYTKVFYSQQSSDFFKELQVIFSVKIQNSISKFFHKKIQETEWENAETEDSILHTARTHKLNENVFFNYPRSKIVINWNKCCGTEKKPRWMEKKSNCDDAIRSCCKALCGLCAATAVVVVAAVVAVVTATSFVDRPKRIFLCVRCNRSSTILKCIVENVVNSRSHIDDIYQHPFLLWHILIYTNYFGMFASVHRLLPDTVLTFFAALAHFLGACV